MTYPPIYTRLSNFSRDAQNGLVSPEPAKVDAELNNIQLSLSQSIAALRAITSADGHLKNAATAIAQALVGSDTVLAPASPGPVVTDVPWVSTMTVESVLVMVSTTVLNSTQFTVAAGGTGNAFLTVTPTTYPATGTRVSVWAFEPGAGILTKLASLAQGEGADLIGVADTGNFFGATTVEGALAETAGALAALQTALGSLAEYFKRDGSVDATGNFDLASVYKVINAIDGVDPGDYVTVRQITNYISAWSDLSQFYLKRDGTTAMAGPLNFGNNKGYNLADPDLAVPLDAVNVRAMLRVVATSGASPVGVVVDYAGSIAPTNWLFCDGTAYLETAYPVLAGILGGPFKTGYATGVIAAACPALLDPADVTGGKMVGIPTNFFGGVGYGAVPHVDVENTDGGAAVTSQPVFAVTVTAVVSDGGSGVTGGVVSIALTGAPGSAARGAGIRAGAIIRVFNAEESKWPTILSILAPLPAGYFRVPDLRGRVSMGAGTESKLMGVTDPPNITKGDDYDATPRTVGQLGGAERVALAETELPFGTVVNPLYRVVDVEMAGILYTVHQKRVPESAAASVAHDNTPPFFVLNKIVKAS